MNSTQGGKNAAGKFYAVRVRLVISWVLVFINDLGGECSAMNCICTEEELNGGER